MGAVEFTSNVVTAAVWPVVILLIVLSQRGAVTRLLDRNREAKITLAGLELKAAEREALQEIGEETVEIVEEALGEVSPKPQVGMSPRELQAEREGRAALQRLVDRAAWMGYLYRADDQPPRAQVTWSEDGTPDIDLVSTEPSVERSAGQTTTDERLDAIRAKAAAARLRLQQMPQSGLDWPDLPPLPVPQPKRWWAPWRRG